jgi:uncharacterized protein (DUF58 family)
MKPVTTSASVRYRTKIVRLGWHFGFIAAFAILGGSLRGFNLMLILAGAMLGAMIMQWRWSKTCLQTLTMRRRLPSEAFAGTSFRVRFLATNSAWSMPIWMIRMDDRIYSDRYGETISCASIGRIGAGRTVSISQEAMIQRRGRYDFGPITVSTRFPFALIESTATYTERNTLYVYPQLFRLSSQWRRRLSSQTGGMSTTARRNGLNEGEFYGLREWHNGDSPRWIHWRTTARLDEPAVRQFEQHRRFDVCLVFDAFGTEIGETESQVTPQTPGRDWQHRDFESAVSLTASLIAGVSAAVGNRVALVVASQRCAPIIENAGVESSGLMMQSLAEVMPTMVPDLSAALVNAAGLTKRPRDIVVVSPRSREHAILSEPRLIAQLAPLVRRGSLQWIDTSTELDRWVYRVKNTRNSEGSGNRFDRKLTPRTVK